MQLRTPTTRSLGVRLLIGILLWDVALVGVDSLLGFTWRFRNTPEALRGIFRAASEDSLVVWTSVVSMFALGVLCVLLGSLKRSWRWKLSGALFIALSMDDEAMLHERLGWLSEIRGQDVYPWVIVVMPIVGLLGAAALAHIWQASDARIRPRALLACCLWFVALALEVAEKRVTEAGLLWRELPVEHYTKLLEETCELIAPGVLLSCIVDELAAAISRRERMLLGAAAEGRAPGMEASQSSEVRGAA